MIFALFYVVHFTPGCTVFHREAKRRHKLEPVAGFEPATSSLPRKCSTPELHRQYVKFRAEDEAQTRDPQLGRLMLYQLSYFRILYCWWVVMDSNHRSRKTADLQSAPFGRSGNYPLPFKRCKVTIIYWFLQHQRRKKLNFLYKNRQIAVANTLFGTLPIYALRKKRPTMGNFAITRSRCSTR